MGVVRYGDKPVLMVAQPPAGPYGRAVIDVDSRVSSGPIMRAAQRLAPQAETHLVRVAPTGTTRFWPSQTAIGDSTDLLIDCVSQIGADLLVAGSDRAFRHGHDDPSNLLRQASAQRCDLLFVRNQ